jgi:hypothetical protein
LTRRQARRAQRKAAASPARRILATDRPTFAITAITLSHDSTFSWVTVPHEAIPEVHNGSMFLLDCGQGPFMVTAGRVYTGYLAEHGAARRIICPIGDLEFHPEERLIDLQECSVSDDVNPRGRSS